MQYELVIKADTNDADYDTATHIVTQETINDLIIPVVKAIKARNAATRRGSGEYNWPTKERADQVGGGAAFIYEDILTTDQIEKFDDLVPYGDEEYGIHTIESIEYYPLPVKVKLL